MQQFFAYILLIAVIGGALAQMTFSDGWGNVKRSAPIGSENAVPALDRCNVAYSQALTQLHHELMEVYREFRQCQKHLVGPSTP